MATSPARPTTASTLPTWTNPGNRSALPDDGWVFTEENPGRKFHAIANIAASVNAMRDYNTQLADETQAAAEGLWQVERPVDNDDIRRNKIHAAVELFRATGKSEYRPSTGAYSATR
ncbi:hypothetical protein [Microbulbifer sp.]|uniref:hypothetical protein n=1 Tax=Microbulbifer sp. TaxID=1908541 RepID=UPI003F2B3F05